MPDAVTPAVSVILPTYNERDNIVVLLTDLTRVLAAIPHELVVVDDDSPDGTSLAVTTAIAANRWTHVRLITRTANRGLTNSIQAGIDAARGDIVAWMDCDFSHPPAVMGELVAAVAAGLADAAVASRFAPGGTQKRAGDGGDSPAAVVLSTLLNRTMSAIAGFSFTDFTSGFIAVRRRFIRDPLSGDYGEYFIDLVLTLHARGARLLELPFRSPPRRSGASKTAPDTATLLRHGRLYASKLASVACRRMTGRSPV